GENGSFWIDMIGFLFSALSGVFDGYSSNISETNRGFDSRKAELAGRLSKISGVFTFIGVGLSSYITWNNDSLSWSQRLGQISSWVFGAAVSGYVGAALGVAIVNPVAAAILAAAFAVLMSVLMVEFVAIYLSSRIVYRRNFVV
ncbi:hypothetical protein, partial [Endothiovibrio diazotrophicus]